MFIISEIVQVRVNGKWMEAEILDITDSGAYVYIFDTGKHKNVRLRDIRG